MTSPAPLAARPGQTYTRVQLLDALHGVVYERFDRSIDSHIKNLRRKIERDATAPDLVLPVYGVGYKFQAPAVRVCEPGGARCTARGAGAG